MDVRLRKHRLSGAPQSDADLAAARTGLQSLFREFGVNLSISAGRVFDEDPHSKAQILDLIRRNFGFPGMPGSERGLPRHFSVRFCHV